MSGIVVGVDGSDESKDALRWALDEARLRGCSLRAVHAWLYPMVYGPGMAPPAFALPVEALRDEAKRVLEAAVEEVVPDEAGVELHQIVAEGPEASVLIDAAQDADLLVVGSRGRGGFTGLLLGSVSQQCASHARCPVVIVRGRG